MGVLKGLCTVLKWVSLIVLTYLLKVIFVLIGGACGTSIHCNLATKSIESKSPLLNQIDFVLRRH